MNICPIRRVELILAQIIPRLPSQPRFDLRKAQIIVGVRKDEEINIRPTIG